MKRKIKIFFFLGGGFLWEIARYEHMLTTIIISQIIRECKETAILLLHSKCYRYRVRDDQSDCNCAAY